MEDWFYDDALWQHPRFSSVVVTSRSYYFNFDLFTNADWKLLGDTYSLLPGYVGSGITPSTQNFPYWFGKEKSDDVDTDESWETEFSDAIYLTVSMEPGCLQVLATVELDDWIAWNEAFEKMTRSLPHRLA